MQLYYIKVEPRPIVNSMVFLLEAPVDMQTCIARSEPISNDRHAQTWLSTLFGRYELTTLSFD